MKYIMPLLIVLCLRTFVVQAFKIPSGSTIPTLLIGDHILVSKLTYGIRYPSECRWEDDFTFLPIKCYAMDFLVRFNAPQRGDMIVFAFPEDESKDFIKRIIGLPGETILIKNKVVYINGHVYEDTAFTQRIDPGIIDGKINPRDNFGPVTIPERSYFVLGDNRDQSLDSRFWGYVREEKIKGKAFLIYWSWIGKGSTYDWVRWERFGKRIE